jgi:glycosyltransferase involved in cell wall biosynthesis
LKILFITYMETKDPGGINKTVSELAKNLSALGHEITVIQPNPGDLSAEEIYNGFKIIRISSWVGRYFYDLNPTLNGFLKNNIEDLNPDIVHVHGYHTLQSLGVINTLKGLNISTPLIFSPYYDVSHGTFAGKHFMNLYNVFGKRAIKKCDYIISSSNFEAGKLVNVLGADPGRIKVISLGVDVSINGIEPSNEGVSISKSKVMGKNKIKLLYTGYLINRKGVDFILRGLESLVHELNIEDVVLTVVGDGPEKRNLLKLARDLKLDNYIVWQPFLSRDELIKKIEESDMYLLLSRSEAYGITVAESLSLGTPCIVTEKTALKEFKMEPGCFVVEYPPEPRAVAENILHIYGNDVTIGPFTDKIRGWKRVSEDYELFYNDLIN